MAIPRSSAGKLPQTKTRFPSPEPNEESTCPCSSSEDASDTSSEDGIEWKTKARVSPGKAVDFGDRPALSPASLPLVLRESERSFLKRDYKRSLFLVHSYFEEKNRTSNGSCSNSISSKTQSATQDSPRVEENSIKSDSVRLVPPIRIPGNSRTRIFSFVVDLPFMDVPKATSISTNCSLLHEEIVAAASEAAAIDQLAAIGLQSWYELSKMEEQLSRKQRTTHSQSSRHRWSLLVEILDYYAYSRDTNVTFQKEEECQSRPRGRLSIEMLARLWISFWESNGCEIEAFVWTVQYLHLSIHSGSIFKTKNKTNTMVLEELWLRCVCQQIPSYLNNNTELAQKILNIVTEKPKVPLQSTDFREIFKEINMARKSKATDFGGIDPDAVITVLVESLDSYLKNGESDNRSSGIAADNRSSASVGKNPLGHVSVSRNTVFEAHHWLVQQQDNKQREKAQGNQNELQKGQGDCGILDSIALQDSSTKMPDLDHSCPPTTGFMDSYMPLAAIPFAQQAFDFLSKLGKRLPLRALVAARDIFQRVFLRVFPDMEYWSGSIGEIMKTRVLQLVCSSYFLSVSGPTKAGDAELSQQQKEERLQILRQHLQQTLLSLVLFWAGWRGRKLLWKAGKGAVLASLAPLLEILEALKPQE